MASFTGVKWLRESLNVDKSDLCLRFTASVGTNSLYYMWSKLCTTATCDDWWVLPTLRSGISTTTWPSTTVILILYILAINTDNSVMKCLNEVVYIIHGYRLKVSKVMHSKQPLSYSFQLLLYRQAVQLFAVCSNFSVYLEMCCLVCRPA